MPLFITESLGELAHILVWKIEESQEVLRKQIQIHSIEQKKLQQLNHPEKILEFLALRMCLKEYFGNNPPINYTDNGKPYLPDGPNISFSHTRGFAAIIISEKLEVGIDIELYRKSIQRIASRFMRKEEAGTMDKETNASHILAYWGCKEVIVKIEGDRRLNFKSQIRIAPFLYDEYLKTSGMLLRQNNNRSFYSLLFRRIDELHLTYGWQLPQNGNG